MTEVLGTASILSMVLALAGGLVAARSIYRSLQQSGRREFVVFSFCYSNWLVWTSFALGWKYPEITIWCLVVVSFLYLPILVALAVRTFGRKVNATK